MQPPPRSFERKLRRALVLFSVLPSLLLVAGGTYAVSRAMRLGEPVVAWERVAASGTRLIDAAERSGDPALVAAARTHRTELSDSVMHARRWQFLLERVLLLMPGVALIVGGVLLLLALRASRRMGNRLMRPVADLVGWAGLVARGEALPPVQPHESATGEFGVLRTAFRSMAAELEAGRARELEAERQRTWMAMARRVAHELKNPLTPMRLAVSALSRRADERPAYEAEALEVIAAESERLEELARSFAQFGRLPEGPPSEVDLREMMEYLLRTHLPPQVEATLDAPAGLPPVHGHPDALGRAFANLLLNAGDAVPAEGGSVRVALAADGEWVEVRIADSGPGIPPAHRERIWEADFTTKSKGTGLGLALVRQTVLAHGGEVSAANGLAGGAEFRVRLPAATP